MAATHTHTHTHTENLPPQRPLTFFVCFYKDHLLNTSICCVALRLQKKSEEKKKVHLSIIRSVIKNPGPKCAFLLPGSPPSFSFSAGC